MAMSARLHSLVSPTARRKKMEKIGPNLLRWSASERVPVIERTDGSQVGTRCRTADKAFVLELSAMAVEKIVCPSTESCVDRGRERDGANCVFSCGSWEFGVLKRFPSGYREYLRCVRRLQDWYRTRAICSHASRREHYDFRILLQESRNATGKCGLGCVECATVSQACNDDVNLALNGPGDRHFHQLHMNRGELIGFVICPICLGNQKFSTR